MKSYKTLFTALLALLFTRAAFAQQNLYNQVSITPPNAASLGKYADVPVNYHTGIPQISVPLYTIIDGPLQLPLQLSYHASGLKVAEPASWVGAGWNILPGAITRTILGAPDERLTSNVNMDQFAGHLSDNGYAGYLWQPASNGQSGGVVPLLKDVQLGYLDGEPDLFFFNFAGYSGKFYFGDDKVPVLLPAQDIRIDYNYTPGLRKSIESFTLTTPDGTRYFFGATPSTTDTDPVERSVAYTASNGMGNDGRSVAAWYLNRIVSANSNHTITLQYEPEQYSYFNVISGPIPYDDNSAGGGSGLNKVIIDGVRLKSIRFSDGEVNFVPGALRTDLSGPALDLTEDANQQARTLGEVRISSHTGVCKKYALQYGYFEDNSNRGSVGNASVLYTDCKRLKLLQVQESTCDGSLSLPPYQFTYFTEAVPRRLSFSQDHWGFSNGVMNNTTLIPTLIQNQFEDIPGADRDSRWPEMRGGTLSSIQYPTGGQSVFEFEPNRTRVSYTRYTPEYRFSTAVGYDNNNTQTSMQTLSGNPYKVRLSNGSCTYGASSCAASVQVFNSSNALVFSLYAESGQQQQGYTILPAGTYRIVMSKNGAGQGAMASATFTELVPGLYEADEIVGGLRIKSIQSPDPAQPGGVQQTQYHYEANGRTTGILYSRPVYVQTLKNSGPRYITRSMYHNGSVNYEDWEVPMEEQPYFSIGARKAIKSAAPLLPMSSSQGNPVGYSEVKVSQTGNGYSIYRYYGSNLWDFDNSDVATRKIDRSSTHPAAPEYPAAPLPFEYKRGELQYEGHFTEAGKLMREVTYLPEYAPLPVTTPGIRVYAELRQPPNGDFMWVATKTEFELQSVRKTKMTLLEKAFDSVASLYRETKQTKFYESTSHQLPTRVTTTNESDDTLTLQMRYTADVILPGCAGIDTCWSGYQNELAATWTLYQQTHAACADPDCLRAAKSWYNGARLRARHQYSTCRINRLAVTKACLDASVAGADTLLRPLLLLQRQNRILPLEQTNWRNNALVTADYNRFAPDPGADSLVNIAVQQQISADTLASAFTPMTNSNTAVQKDSRYADAEHYLFKNGFLYEMKKTGKTLTSYIWDYGDARPVAMATDAGSAQIAFSSFESANSGNFSYAAAGISTDATAPAGSRVYQLAPGQGITGTTDPGRVFTVSAYVKGSAANCVVNGVAPSRTGKTRNGWTYYEWRLPAGTSSLNISGTARIDELRMHPFGADMVCYTYLPMLGMATQNEGGDLLLYYDYDALGRLIRVRDADGNPATSTKYSVVTGSGN
jgi:hypothetical protein